MTSIFQSFFADYPEQQYRAEQQCLWFGDKCHSINHRSPYYIINADVIKCQHHKQCIIAVYLAPYSTVEYQCRVENIGSGKKQAPFFAHMLFCHFINQGCTGNICQHRR
ncbi:MAG: hypothetical protein IKJ05_04125, partial [Oscillospiraceae bacterium]|nr:hypothetical protein [Oscillospiraceae bacterium]